MIHTAALSFCRSRNARFLSLSVFASVCLLLSGCDSQSANSSLRSQVSSSDGQSAAQSKSDTAAFNQQSMDEAAHEADDVAGRPLLASAQTESWENTPEAAQAATPAKENYSLEATLIGDYGGTVPCNNCERIDVTLNLFSDGTVAKTSVYQNQTDKPQSITLSGIYRQDDHTITIVYENQHLESYYIDGNYLIQLNDDEQPNEDYTLSRL